MVKHKTRRLAISLMIFSGIFAGINSPVINYALQTIPTELFGFLRVGISLLLVAPIVLLRKRKKLQFKYIAVAMLFGLLIYLAANGLFYLGVKRSGAVNAAIIGLLEPLLLFVFSVEIMKEKFNPRILSGIIIAFAGSMLVIFGPVLIQQNLSFQNDLMGNLLLLGCVMCGVGGAWLAKTDLRHVDRVQLLFWSLIPATLVYGILSIDQWNQIPSIFKSSANLYAVLYGAVFNGVLVYLFMFYALKRVKVEEYSIFGYISPAVAALVAVLFFGERFTPLLLLGVLIISTGLYLAEVHNHKRTRYHFFRSR